MAICSLGQFAPERIWTYRRAAAMMSRGQLAVRLK